MTEENRHTAASPIARRALLFEQIDELERSGDFPAAGIVVAGTSHQAAAVRRLLQSAPPGYLDEIQRGLNEAEDQKFRRAIPDPVGTGDVDPTAAINVERMQATEQIATYRQTDRGRQDVVVELLERIAAAVEKR